MGKTDLKKPKFSVIDIYLSRLKQMSAQQLSDLLSGKPHEAAVWVRIAAMHGLPEAQLRLGRMLLEGKGVAKDEKEALSWFQRASTTGNADALNMVGRCYENGWGVTADYTVAAEYYQRSAQAGHNWAQYNLGHCYLDGNGVVRDTYKAFVWYRKAADQGHVRAMNLLARCYEEGWGVAIDSEAARTWYRKSAEGGYFRGQYNWATLLANEGQLDSASEWFLLAARNGTPNVRRAVANTLLKSNHPQFQSLGLTILASCCEHGEAPDFYRYGNTLSPNIAGQVAMKKTGTESNDSQFAPLYASKILDQPSQVT
jgi:TPR repeat protein